MVERIGDRMSGLMVSYRNLIDEHLLSAYLYDLTKYTIPFILRLLCADCPVGSVQSTMLLQHMI